MSKGFALAMLTQVVLAGADTAIAQTAPDRLAIYYGFPSLVNGSAGNLNAATEVFNDYDIVVFGARLEEATHLDHAKTVTIINNLKTALNDTAVYGYVAIGMTNLPSTQTPESLPALKKRVDDWALMSVAGVFLDQGGYDFGVSRQRQRDIVGYIHGKGLSAFINAHNPDDVFSPAPHATLNPAPGLATLLGTRDIYLYESFQIIVDQFQPESDWVSKSDLALQHKNLFGTRIATVTTTATALDPNNLVFDQANHSKLFYAWWSTVLYGFDAMGWGERFFSAGDNLLPFRTRPCPGNIGSAFLSPTVSHASPVHTRTTTVGTIEVKTDTHTGRFLSQQGAGVVPADALARARLTEWMVSLQYTNPSLPSYGAIKIHHDPGHIDGNGVAFFRVLPYSTNLGVLGLLRARRPLALTVAERWIDWYLGHLNPNGTPADVVYDHWYTADGTGETTCVDAQTAIKCNWDDASDSYAATFLTMVQAYVEVGASADRARTQNGILASDFVRARRIGIEKVAQVILFLQQADGLTWAKDNFRVKFTMDNSEVYRGLRAMEQLERDVFNDLAAAATYQSAAERVRKGMLEAQPQLAFPEPLLNGATDLFRVAKFENGTFQEADLDQWFPGTVALQWPYVFGVIEPRSTRAAKQLAAMNASWDGSPNLDWTTTTVDPTGFLWPSIGYAARRAGDGVRARRHADFVLSRRFPDFDYPWTIDDAGWLLQTLSVELPEQVLTTGNNAGRRHLFGIRLDVDGDVAVAGAPGEDVTGTDSGAAYVLVRTGATWSVAAKLLPSDGAAGDSFGSRVAMSGDTAIVAAIFDDDACLPVIDPACNAGSVYVYERPAGGWSGTLTQSTKLTAGDAASSMLFGQSVDICGDALVVGSQDFSKPASGRAYVFERNQSGAWTETAKLTPANAPTTDFFFGQPVAISGNIIAVRGGRGLTLGSGVYVYEKPATGWTDKTQDAVLTATDAGPLDSFGVSLAISEDGDTAMVGSFQARSNGPGAVYVYHRRVAGWSDKTQDAKLTASDGDPRDGFGVRMAISGETLVVTANGDDDGLLCPDPTCNSGAVYVFRRPAACWADATEDLKIIASDGIGDEQFGSGIGIDGNIVVVGSPFADHEAPNGGSVYAYELPFAVTPQSAQPVSVEPVDPTTGTKPVKLTFPSVTSGGTTTVTTTVGSQPLPSGFSFGDPPTVYQIETTATFPQVTVCIDYGDTQFDNENSLRLLHFENGQWNDVTTSLDTANNLICGTTTSLSPFAVVEVADPTVLLARLIADVRVLSINHGTRNSLLAKLEVAQRSLAKGKRTAAKNMLGAFINSVQAQRGKKIPDAIADDRIARARRIIHVL